MYLSSLNRGADECELEAGDAGRGIRGVKGRCGPGGSIGAVAVLSADTASLDFSKFVQILFPSFQKDGRISWFSYFSSVVLTQKICIVSNFTPASRS